MSQRSIPFVMIIAFSCSFLSLSAQQTGRVVGYINNSATTLYLEGVRVRADSGQSTLTDQLGRYELTLPAGPATLTASYIELESTSVSVHVPVDAIVRQDIGLRSNIYEMQTVVVSGPREGEALALTRQKNAINVKNVVSTDAFGNIADGNVGEFLQRLPGVSGTYVGQDVRQITIRGIAADLNSVQVDGVEAGQTGEGRATGLDTFNLGLIESIELTKAPTPDMPANSIGGNVNMITKSAFDRADKRYFDYTLGGAYRTAYPLNGEFWWQEPIKNIGPSASFTYGDRWGEEERLGVLFTTAFHSSPGGERNAVTTYANGDSVRIRSVQSPRQVGAPRTRLTFGNKLDYKLTDEHILSLNLSHAWFHESNDARAMTWAAALNSDAALAPGFTELHQENLPHQNNAVTMANTTNDITGRTIIIAPSGRFRNEDWEIDYGVSYNDTISYIEGWPEDRHFSGRAKGLVTARMRRVPGQNIAFNVDRDSPGGVPYVTQTAGPDAYDLANYTDLLQVAYQDRVSQGTTTNARVNVRRKLDFAAPTWIKAGATFLSSERLSKWPHQRLFTYLGPDGVANSGDENWAGFEDQSGKYADALFPGVRSPTWPDPIALSADPLNNPTHWAEDVDYPKETADRRHVEGRENITSAYVMSNVDLGHWSVLTGVRMERTDVKGEGPLNSVEFPAYSGRQTQGGSYQDVFPNFQLKYDLDNGFVVRGSYTTSIGRPSLGSVFPLTNVNDNNMFITQSNPDLKPQFSKNFDLNLEYYFEPGGLLSASVFLKEIEDFIFTDTSGVVGDGPDNGFDGEYVGYELRRPSNGGHARYRGFELSYQQRFKFLPGWWKGFGVNLNYTRLETEGNYGGPTDVMELAGFVPESANAALTYNYGRFNLRFDTVYRGLYLIGASTAAGQNQYSRSRMIINFKSSVKITDHLAVTLDIENLNNSMVHRTYYGTPDRPGLMREGSPKIVAGIRGRF